MKMYKTQCEALVESGAIILVRDGFTKKGIPVYVTRKVGCNSGSSVWRRC